MIGCKIEKYASFGNKLVPPKLIALGLMDAIKNLGFSASLFYQFFRIPNNQIWQILEFKKEL